MLRLHNTNGGLGMHQGKNAEGITEYHLCSECKDALTVPTDPYFRSFELCCLQKRSECNHGGGLTCCPVFQEKEEI